MSSPPDSEPELHESASDSEPDVHVSSASKSEPESPMSSSSDSQRTSSSSDIEPLVLQVSWPRTWLKQQREYVPLGKPSQEAPLTEEDVWRRGPGCCPGQAAAKAAYFFALKSEHDDNWAWQRTIGLHFFIPGPGWAVSTRSYTEDRWSLREVRAVLNRARAIRDILRPHDTTLLHRLSHFLNLGHYSPELDEVGNLRDRLDNICCRGHEYFLQGLMYLLGQRCDYPVLQKVALHKMRQLLPLHVNSFIPYTRALYANASPLHDDLRSITRTFFVKFVPGIALVSGLVYNEVRMGGPLGKDIFMALEERSRSRASF